MDPSSSSDEAAIDQQHLLGNHAAVVGSEQQALAISSTLIFSGMHCSFSPLPILLSWLSSIAQATRILDDIVAVFSMRTSDAERRGGNMQQEIVWIKSRCGITLQL